MPFPEPIWAVRDFLETGGNVLLAILAVTLVMWTLILERFWYFRGGHRRELTRALTAWGARAEHTSWHAHQVRRMLISRVRLKLDHSLLLIKTLVALCPLLGLLGTVTGMI